MSDLYVAESIIEQIKYADPYALMSWGAKNFTGSSKETNIIEITKNEPSIEPYYKNFGCRGWMQMDVNGAKFKGRVYIGLNGLDLYDVICAKITYHKDYSLSFKVKKEAKDIYNEDLMKTIDNLIERD